MELNIAPNEILQIDDARITFRNFSGEASQYNRKGDRNFALIIPTQEMADELIARGWNVKIKPARDEDEYDLPFMYLNVKVSYNEFGPNVFLHSGRAMRRLDEDGVGILDHIDIERIDMDIAPSDWTVNGKTGRAAYLRTMHVTQRLDRFAERYGNYADDVLPG